MHMKRLAAALALTALVATPFAASALSVDELQSQLRELLSKVAQLQEQLRAATGNGTEHASSSVSDIRIRAVPRICSILTVANMASIGAGSRGDAVTGLQEFLRDQGVFTGESTGYFGGLTEEALKRWQSAEGIARAGSAATTGWGLFGPATRARIKAKCGVSDLVTVSPEKGTAPLTVTVTSKVGDSGSYRPSYADGQDTLIDFGDGTERVWVNCEGTPSDTLGTACTTPKIFSHTYAADGAYTITLLKAGGMCVGGCPERTLGTAYVKVGSAEPIACTMEYRPVCGEKQVQCITAPCNPVQQTYGNACSAKAAGAKVVYEGECRTVDAGSGAPVISGLSGPTSLAVNEIGTWKVTASDPENGTLSYAITWGDEWFGSGAGTMARPAATIMQQSTFTHGYARAGRYTVAVTVTDADGKTARTTSTVEVQQTACTKEYRPVCGRPSGCANTCAPGMACPAICRLHEPQTYSNRCMMNNANAEFISEGVCASTTDSQ